MGPFAREVATSTLLPVKVLLRMACGLVRPGALRSSPLARQRRGLRLFSVRDIGGKDPQRRVRPGRKLSGNDHRESERQQTADWPMPQTFFPALTSSNVASARSNLELKSHIASIISRKVADVLALSACPKAKMLLFRRYPMILGSEIL